MNVETAFSVSHYKDTNILFESPLFKIQTWSSVTRFGEILKVFYYFLKVYLALKKILTYFGNFLYFWVILLLKVSI